MPKCKRCPIRKECNKMGMFRQVKGKDEKMIKRKVCPLTWAINLLLRIVKEEKEEIKAALEAEKQGKNNSL